MKILNLQQTKPKENDQLDLFRSCHLQPENNWDRQSKQDNLCNDFIKDRQFQDDKPVEAFGRLCSFEVPLGVNWETSDRCREEERNYEGTCECHKGKDTPFQPHVGENAEIKA